MYAARGLAALVLCATALTACTDDDPDSDTSGDPATSTSAGTGDPTESSSPTDTAAAGELVEGPTFSFHLPDGWEVRDGMTGLWICGPTDSTRHELQMVVSWRNLQPYPDLATMATEARSSYRDMDQATRVLQQTTFGGQPAYHLEGEGTIGPMDEFGVAHANGTVTVTFDLDRTPAEREELIVAVSAGWRWT